ncbi:MAG: hypothetical protein CM15mP83_2350 [Flavobacteriaceae bacterium]|nr:MAG: hypothetical protein CM15mP83_2350 [Flavobacteriaceae bacterium]
MNNGTIRIYRFLSLFDKAILCKIKLTVYQESFEDYCHKNNIIYNDKDLKMEELKRLIHYRSTIFLKRFTSGRITLDLYCGLLCCGFV